ncbi:MAG: hypothetical protein WA208_13115 [Thermoanaerobaculia bacterium]
MAELKVSLPGELADALQAAGARLRFGFPRWLRPFVVRGVVGITLGRTIYLLPELEEDARADIGRILRHELVHVRQVNRLTLPLFLLRYAGEFTVGLIRELSFDRAYRNMPLEAEAFREEAEDDPAHGSFGNTSL